MAVRKRLKEYEKKRDFEQTSEPSGRKRATARKATAKKATAKKSPARKKKSA